MQLGNNGFNHFILQMEKVVNDDEETGNNGLHHFIIFPVMF